MLSEAHIQKVELIGGESWWSHNAGSIVVGVAAIIGASLAAYVAIRNHRQQLAHDREMRSREATREVIDLAVIGIGEAIAKTATFAGMVSGVEHARERLASLEEKAGAQQLAAENALEVEKQNAKAAKNRAYDSARAVDIQSMRLKIRLGSDHTIVECHGRTARSLDKLQDSVSIGVKEKPQRR